MIEKDPVLEGMMAQLGKNCYLKKFLKIAKIFFLQFWIFHFYGM